MSDFEIKNQVLIKYTGRGSSVVAPRNLTAVRIPDMIKEIGESAFAYCRGIETVWIPDGVTAIGKNAFFSCRNLKSIRIPESVVKIDDYALKDCPKLTDLTLPEGIQKYGTEVFSRGVHLKNYPDDFVILNHILYQYIGTNGTIVIPEGVTYAGMNSLSGWEMDYSVEHVVFPASMESIDLYALHQDEKMKSITCHQIQVFVNEEEMKWTNAIELIRNIVMFLRNPSRKKERFLKQYREDMLFCLEDAVFQKIVDTGKIYSGDALEYYLKMAIEHQLYTKQMILMHYQYQHSVCKPRNLFL